MMRSDHLTKLNKVNDFLSAMLQKGPRLSNYQRPSPASDVLFESDSPHIANQATCERCDTVRVVNRPPRASNTPEIHYGLVASGDRVVRSATKRNATGRDIGDILCFEMEAAGIMSEFSCIVIRGISDYADSHKSDVWQNYAAAAAAGCAKELLSHLNPEDLQVSPITALQHRFSHGSSSSHRLAGNSNISVSREESLQTMTSTASRQSSREDSVLHKEQKQMLLDSLRFDQINSRQMTIQKSRAKTCKWVLKNSAYLDWLDVTKLEERHGFL